MSDDRKRLCGSAFKKVAKLKLVKEQKFISQTTKLTSYFGNQRTSIYNPPSEIETTSEQISNQSSDKNSDPALWSINEDLINYIYFHSFTQDLSIIDFSKYKRSYSRTVKGIKKMVNRF
ncbi:uncharacterized protein LOC126909505 isoform X2 [Daktulosphaira vitifoliae]|uniref:uncharacterized protein LOC126909505 isoform X2 n=1 Tax=Daktulosphaira vitifoliae TaxID=58002 RepID=UPI0021AAEE01|nr:uncharacterized protein LOC126909505 isoform X2 [Daktulosphaira vitifoliae]